MEVGMSLLVLDHERLSQFSQLLSWAWVLLLLSLTSGSHGFRFFYCCPVVSVRPGILQSFLTVLAPLEAFISP